MLLDQEALFSTFDQKFFRYSQLANPRSSLGRCRICLSHPRSHVSTYISDDISDILDSLRAAATIPYPDLSVQDSDSPTDLTSVATLERPNSPTHMDSPPLTPNSNPASTSDSVTDFSPCNLMMHAKPVGKERQRTTR